MFKNYATIIIASVLLTACSGTTSKKVATLQKKDKALTCAEVQLEINEAEYYRKSAENNKSIGISSVIMPIGYISTYMNANVAVKSADERIDYLNRIYDIRKCDDAEVLHEQAMKQRTQKPRAQTVRMQQPQQQQFQQYAPAPVAYAPNPYVRQAPAPYAYYQPMSMGQQPAPYEQNFYKSQPVSDYMVEEGSYW